MATGPGVWGLRAEPGRRPQVPADGATRVVLRVAASADPACPEVDAYKRLGNNELVSINATLQVEAQMSG